MKIFLVDIWIHMIWKDLQLCTWTDLLLSTLTFVYGHIAQQICSYPQQYLGACVLDKQLSIWEQCPNMQTGCYFTCTAGKSIC